MATSAEANAAAGSAGTEASRAMESVPDSRVSCCMERSAGCVLSAGADAAGPLSKVEGGEVRQEGRSCSFS